MHHGAFAGEKPFDAAGAVGGELVGGGLGLAAGTMTGYDETRIDDGADEGGAFVDGLSVLLVGMESESELTLKIIANDIDIAHELMFLGHGDDDEKVVDVAAVMFVTEIEGDEAVELVEKDIGNELTGKIANDDTAAGFAMKETFVSGEGIPIFFGAADNNVFHRVIIDNLMPEEFDGLI